jgi:hypothetical protein
MRRITLALALLLAISTVCPTETPVKIQTIPAPETSGAVNIGGDRVMLIADEGYDVKIVSDAAATFQNGDPKDFASNMKPAIADVTVGTEASKKIIDDLEDAAWDNKEQVAFVISSHSLNKNKKGFKDKPGRYKLARLVFKGGKVDVSREVDVLRGALEKTFSFVGAAMKLGTEIGGIDGNFNIEGLAFDPITSSLLIGLRSPTPMLNGKPCAVVFRLKNPHELFNDKPAPPEFDSQLIPLDLGGLGIRGMTYDDERKGFWIIAGRSDDPPKGSNPTPVPSSLWFWDSTKPGELPRKAQTDSFGPLNLEGVCLLTIGGKRGLLLTSDDGDETQDKISRYLWIPVP